MVQNLSLVPSAARTVSANGNDANFSDPTAKGYGQFVVDITADSGTTPTLAIVIEGFDPTSGKYFTLLQSANLTAAGTTVLHVGPGLPVTANVSANAMLTRNFRVRWIIGGTTPSFTFTVGCSVA